VNDAPNAPNIPKLTLASLAAVVEAQRAEIVSLRASVELLMKERGEADVGALRPQTAGPPLPPPSSPPLPPPPPGTSVVDYLALRVTGAGKQSSNRSSDSAQQGRNVRQKSTAVPTPPTLHSLPEDVLHMLASRLRAFDLGHLMLCAKGLRDGLRGATPYEVVLHGSSHSLLVWSKSPPSAEYVLSATPTTKLGRMCRNLRNSGTAKQLLRLRVFLWNGFREDAPELEALLHECIALEKFELCMPPLVYRTDPFMEHAFEWTERLFAAASAGIITLEVPLVPALMDGLGFERFTQLQHLTVSTYGAAQATASPDGSICCSLVHVAPAGGATIKVPVIETILLHLPRLRSLVVRGNSRHQLRHDIELISESLESLIVYKDKEACVGSYNCPKLRTLRCSGLIPSWSAPLSSWTALETGTHAMDLTTVPVDLKPTWFTRGFVDGVFAAEDLDT